MKRRNDAISTEGNPNAEELLHEFSETLTFLTGRVVQFIEDLANTSGIPPSILAERVLQQLGDSESGGTPGSEEDLSSLPTASTETNPKPRKVAVARSPRRKVQGKNVICPTCKKKFHPMGISPHMRMAHHQIYKKAA